MRWLDAEPVLSVPPAVQESLLRRALDRRPGDPALREKLGLALADSGNYGAAVEMLEIAAKGDSLCFGAWADLAHCYGRLQRFDAALDACRRGETRNPTAAIHYQRGRILLKQGAVEEAYAALRAAVALGYEPALRTLLSLLVRNPSGAELLEFCDTLPAAFRETALVRGNRAIALSRLGRTEEALRIVDLERHVAQVTLQAPPGYESMDAFNCALADEILTAAPHDADRTEFNIDYNMYAFQGAAYKALRTLIQAAIERYLTEAEARGLTCIMPPPPDPGMLGGASVVLYGTGRNGEHLHPAGYVSCVYYVSIPYCVATAQDEQGFLVLGKCNEYTRGYVPCWGERYIKPMAGQLVIFPSHFFHDVVPTESDLPRISVAADLWANARTRR
jgi:tetratricopeptide (TPR) repeat protein